MTAIYLGIGILLLVVLTIVGLLTYDEGQGFDGTNYTRLIKPAANVNVTATIAKSQYPETADEEGYLTAVRHGWWKWSVSLSRQKKIPSRSSDKPER